MEQVVHGTDPCVSLYLPASHSTHTELPDVIEYVEAPQSLHRDDDVDFLYFPAVHLIHGLVVKADVRSSGGVGLTSDV